MKEYYKNSSVLDHCFQSNKLIEKSPLILKKRLVQFISLAKKRPDLLNYFLNSGDLSSADNICKQFVPTGPFLPITRVRYSAPFPVQNILLFFPISLQKISNLKLNNLAFFAKFGPFRYVEIPPRQPRLSRLTCKQS